ncbi:IS21 family transposase [Kitasatospora sp. NPDC051914]|uniref:Mu transposase domain-containing protein n=1 Tax=Kitasatospora sp. NPDC051914 TaxID=3154945 RepID=UPI003412C0B2
MLSSEEYKEICALRRQGWSVSAIAHRLGRDRKTVRAYLKGERTVGVRAVPHNEFFRFIPYCQQRLDDDPHLRANVLHSEIVELGYGGAYSTFTRALRRHLTRPCCELCHRGRGPTCGTVEDVQFDWVQLPAPPAEWDCGRQAYLLMGSLTRSGRWRAALTATNDLPHCVEAVDQVLRRLGGTGERWLFDRTPPVCSPAGKVTAAFQEIANYYAASIAIRPQMGPSIPATRARRSVVLHWWDTTADDLGVQTAQDSLDRLAERSDGWRRRADCDAWALLPLPSKPFPARICVQRRVDLHGLVPFEGNFYLLPAGLVGSEVGIRWRLDEPHLSITTTHGAVIACFLRAPRGAGRTIAGRSGPITLERPTRTSSAKAQTCTAGRIPRPRSRAALDQAQALSRRDDEQPTRPLPRAEDQEADPPRS